MENQEETLNQTTDGKNMAIIAYITIIGLIIAYIINSDKKDAFTTYHIKQSTGLALTALALGVIGMIPIIGWVINILGVFVLLYMWIFGMMNAINGKENPVPILGVKYEEWFRNM